ncbi:MAG: sodium:proton antiporter [Lachnospiraceae bacterium]|nr:sodium:proton antiporter [Lachnospiraceae bacterium]
MRGNTLLLILVMWPVAGSFLMWLMCGRSFRHADPEKDIKGYSPVKLWLMTLGVTGFEGMLLIAAWLYGPVIKMDTYTIGRFAGFGLKFAFDGFRIVYAFITTLMWFCSTLVARDYFTDGENLMRYHIFSMWTFAATIGVFLSNDLYTTFIFFEIMSLASYAFVAHTEKADAMKAAGTYLAVAVIGGLVMLMGIMLLSNVCGTLNLREIKDAASAVLGGNDASAKNKLWAAGIMILFGFGAKAGCFPLHIWLPKAHPVAPAPASALLSGVLTKSGVFGVIVLCLEIFHEVDAFGLLICILGMFTMLTGAILAVFSVDLKRTLACSSVSQIGFILIGCGLVPLLKEECTLALSGAMLYMVNHSLFKLTLFLCAAVVYMNLHKLNLNDIKGFGIGKPYLKVLFLIGALGISGVPLLSGYVAKTMIHEGIVEYIHVAGGLAGFFKVLEWLYLISGGMTFAYMTKLFYCLFVDKPSIKTDNHQIGIGMVSYSAITAPAVLIVAFGLGAKLYISKLAVFMGNFNTFSYNFEQHEILNEIKIFSLENLKGSMISISIGIVFFLLIRKFLCDKNADGTIYYKNMWPPKLDLEELIYRPLLLGFFPFLFRTVGAFICNTLPKALFHGTLFALKKAGHFISNILPKALFGAVMWILKKLTDLASNIFDRTIALLSNTVFRPFRHKDHPVVESMKSKLALTEKTGRIITSTLSYGMMMICVGLIITLLYLLYLLFS